MNAVEVCWIFFVGTAQGVFKTFCLCCAWSSSIRNAFFLTGFSFNSPLSDTGSDTFFICHRKYQSNVYSEYNKTRVLCSGLRILPQICLGICLRCIMMACMSHARSFSSSERSFRTSCSELRVVPNLALRVPAFLPSFLAGRQALKQTHRNTDRLKFPNVGSSRKVSPSTLYSTV